MQIIKLYNLALGNLRDVLLQKRAKVGNSTVSSNKHNLLIQEYYKWTANEPLCTWIRRTGGTTARYAATGIYNMSCTTDMYDVVMPQDLETFYLNSKPDCFVSDLFYWNNNLRNSDPSE